MSPLGTGSLRCLWCTLASWGRVGQQIGSNSSPQPILSTVQNVLSVGKWESNSGNNPGLQEFFQQPRGREEGCIWGRDREDRAHHPRSAAAEAPCFAACLVGAEVWFPSLYPFPRQAPGLLTDLKEKSRLRGTAAGMGRGKHGAGAGQQWVLEMRSGRDVRPAALGTAVVRLLKEGRLFSCSSAACSWCPSNL